LEGFRRAREIALRHIARAEQIIGLRVFRHRGHDLFERLRRFGIIACRKGIGAFFIVDRRVVGVLARRRAASACTTPRREGERRDEDRAGRKDG
jgi:hypothetical protein